MRATSLLLCFALISAIPHRCVHDSLRYELDLGIRNTGNNNTNINKYININSNDHEVEWAPLRLALELRTESPFAARLLATADALLARTLRTQRCKPKPNSESGNESCEERVRVSECGCGAHQLPISPGEVLRSGIFFLLSSFFVCCLNVFYFFQKKKFVY